MNYFTVGILAIGFYLGSALLALRAGDGRIKSIAIIPGTVGLVLHLLVLWELVIKNWVNLGFYHSLSFVSALVAASVFISCLWSKARNLLIFTLPLAALFLGLEIFYPEASNKPASAALDTHILLALLAYSLLAVGTLFGGLLLLQNYLLRHKHLGRELDTFPPLSQTENMMFGLIISGFVLLTLTLVSGFWFLQDMFAQHLVHKTVFSLIAWALFAVMLFGRLRFGWRGKKAAGMVITGFSLIMAGYFGSKLVLEKLL